MENKTTIITDPRNREVHLPDGLCMQGGAEGLPPNAYEDYAKVVETPACIIEWPDEHVFYFRSLGWNFTVLIETAFMDDRWLATACYKNPDPAYIRTLLKDGNFIPGEALS